jgi:hypothetical protein
MVFVREGLFEEGNGAHSHFMVVLLLMVSALFESGQGRPHSLLGFEEGTASTVQG